jgi:hypothetical protein
MRTVLVLAFFCTACEAANTRTVTERDFAPRTRAYTSVVATSEAEATVFYCLQDEADRVHLTGVLGQRVRLAAAAAEGQRRTDTLVVLETPKRTVDCKNRAGGQPPAMLEPRSIVVLRGAGPAIRSFVGDTVTVFGVAPARGALLDAEPMSVRLDSMRVISRGQRMRVVADEGAPR